LRALHQGFSFVCALEKALFSGQRHLATLLILTVIAQGACLLESTLNLRWCAKDRGTQKMSQTIEAAEPTIESVLHPTDFSEASLVAFYHALKTALLTKSHFTLFNVSPQGEPEWASFPGVRETLERWELIPKNSPRSPWASWGYMFGRSSLR
jgi:hypothetical protein